MACGSAPSSVVTVISTRLQVERITASVTPSRAFRFGQRGRQRLFAEGQAFAHLDGCGLVTHAGDQQLHFSNMLPSRACAAQVSAEKPSTVTVMMAALRPRHPAVVRRNTSTI